MRYFALYEGQLVTLVPLAYSVNLEGFYRPWFYRIEESGELLADLGRVYVQQDSRFHIGADSTTYDSCDSTSTDKLQCSAGSQLDERKIA